MNQHIFIGSDHGGFSFKQTLIQYLSEKGYQVEDCGAFEFNEHDDYPQYAFAVGEKVAAANQSDDSARGILLCRSGAGVTVAANKVKGIRAASAFTEVQVEHAREHDNINVLTLSGDWLDLEKIKQLVTIFLDTPFSLEERHQRRLNQISEYEK